MSIETKIEELSERIFDDINELEEMLLHDIEIGKVEDKTRFVVKCE